MAEAPKEILDLVAGSEKNAVATDRQIDQLVYEPYGLTEEEIKIVKEANGPE